MNLLKLQISCLEWENWPNTVDELNLTLFRIAGNRCLIQHHIPCEALGIVFEWLEGADDMHLLLVKNCCSQEMHCVMTNEPDQSVLPWRLRFLAISLVSFKCLVMFF